jgi:hypothetical protein
MERKLVKHKIRKLENKKGELCTILIYSSPSLYCKLV